MMLPDGMFITELVYWLCVAVIVAVFELVTTLDGVPDDVVNDECSVTVDGML